MKLKFSLILLVLITPLSLFAQEFNAVITDTTSSKPMLIGYTNLEAFADISFSWWWNSEYKMYDVDSSSIEQLEGKLKDIQIKVVLGTWCSDSRREVPRLFKILDAANYPSESVTIISVNRDKVGLKNEVEKLKIEFVPTLIFIKDDKELGRIIEMPFDTMEKDILEILSIGDFDKE